MYQRAVLRQRATVQQRQVLLDVPTVFVVDPDPATGAMTREVLEGSDWNCEIFRSGRDFLAANHDSRPGCLVLEQRIPDMSGLQLQHRLAASGSVLPLVFVTANTNVSTAVELMRGGAIHVLEKPARSIELLSAIQEAIAQNRDRRLARSQKTKIRELTATLTRKERQVLELIAQGYSGKAVAAALELSVRAIELRRNRLMNKLGVRTSLELMRFAVIAMRELGPQSDVDSSPVGVCA
jgi:FixJ family two-component response regulator